MTRCPHASASLPRKAAELLEQVRTRAPRVHCLMNTVVQKLVADGLSAIGAVPSMTSSPEEVQAFVRKADALIVNLGTLDAQRREAVGLALDAAAETRKAWVLDPAHCDYSPLRAALAQQLLQRSPRVLRANSAEHRLLRIPAGAISVQTGAEDRIGFGDLSLVVENGHALMAKVTGTGCLSGAMIAAFIAVEDDPFIGTASAMLVMGIAAEIAARDAKGPASFEMALLDTLSALSESEVVQNARIRDD